MQMPMPPVFGIARRASFTCPGIASVSTAPSRALTRRTTAHATSDTTIATIPRPITASVMPRVYGPPRPRTPAPTRFRFHTTVSTANRKYPISAIHTVRNGQGPSASMIVGAEGRAGPRNP